MKARVAWVAAALFASAVAIAHPGGPHGPDMERMAILLDLTDTQKADVEKILNEQHEKLRAVHEERRAAGTKPTREERSQFHQEMKQDTLTKLQAVLSPEQIKKFEVLTEHRHVRHEKRSN